MFKEAFAGLFLIFLFYLICRFLQKRKQVILSKIIWIFLILACLANLVYNCLVMFPDFYMDIVNGRFRYGTFSGNLFAYSDDFMFQDEIIFPIIRNREVKLDETAGFYERFFRFYSKSCSTLPVNDTIRREILSHKEDFTFTHEFTCMGIMDYVTDEIPSDLSDSFEKEIYTTLYINLDSLQNQRELVAIMDDDYTLYVMSQDYYEQFIQ